jgi:hypothetical protein
VSENRKKPALDVMEMLVGMVIALDALQDVLAKQGVLDTKALAQSISSRAEKMGENIPAARAMLEMLASRLTDPSGKALKDLLDMDVKGSA